MLLKNLLKWSLLSFSATSLVACLADEPGDDGTNTSLEVVVDESAGVYQPNGIVFDSHDNMFFVDRSNHKVRKLSANGVLSDFAGSGVMGYADGTGTGAQFSYPNDLTIDSNDNLYILHWDYHPSYTSRIRKVTPAGVVTTLATMPSTFASWKRIIAAPNDDLYIATPYRIWKYTGGVLTSFVGADAQDDVDGAPGVARFFNIFDIAMDDQGTLWVGTSTALGQKLKSVDSSGNVTTKLTYTQGERAFAALAFYDGYLYSYNGYKDIEIYDRNSNEISSFAAHLIEDLDNISNLTIHPTKGIYFDSWEHSIVKISWPESD